MESLPLIPAIVEFFEQFGYYTQQFGIYFDALGEIFPVLGTGVDFISGLLERIPPEFGVFGVFALAYLVITFFISPAQKG